MKFNILKIIKIVMFIVVAGLLLTEAMSKMDISLHKNLLLQPNQIAMLRQYYSFADDKTYDCLPYYADIYEKKYSKSQKDFCVEQLATDIHRLKMFHADLFEKVSTDDFRNLHVWRKVLGKDE